MPPFDGCDIIGAMPPMVDLTGLRYGRLTVLRPLGERTAEGGLRWECRCDCGRVTTTQSRHLRSGETGSCGCYRLERMTMVTTHGRSRTPEARAWYHMRERCWNPQSATYKHYGGRGITICPEWDSFARFYADMGPRPSPQHSIDRIDNDGPYAPDNCRWATGEAQRRNTRSCRRLTMDGRTLTLGAWSRELGIPKETFRHRLARWHVA
jgi:hypothetical protein